MIAASLPESDWGTYFLADYHAVAGNRAEAIRLLKRSLELSPVVRESDLNHAVNDPDLAALRGEPEFKALLTEMREKIPKK
jgi:hypothetical protein